MFCILNIHCKGILLFLLLLLEKYKKFNDNYIILNTFHASKHLRKQYKFAIV